MKLNAQVYKPYHCCEWCGLCVHPTPPYPADTLFRISIQNLCFQPFHDRVIVFRYVRQMAGCANFYTLEIFKVAAALIAKCVQRTITEQAIELSGFRLRVTGEVFAIVVIEKSVTIFYHKSP